MRGEGQHLERGSSSHCTKTKTGYDCSFTWADDEVNVQATLDDLAARVYAGEISRSEAEGIAEQILSDIE